jgi:ribosomal protein L20
MPRSVNSVASRARRKKIMKMAKGYFGRRKNVWTVAKNAVEKGLQYSLHPPQTKEAQLPLIVDSAYQRRCSPTRNELFCVYG